MAQRTLKNTSQIRDQIMNRFQQLICLFYYRTEVTNFRTVSFITTIRICPQGLLVRWHLYT